MNFNDRIESFITSENPILQEFVLNTIHDYPVASQGWVETILREALIHSERKPFLVYLKLNPEHEDIINLLVEALRNALPQERQFYAHLVEDLAPELALKYKQVLEPFLSNEYWDLYELLINGEKEDVLNLYNDYLNRLETESHFDSTYYPRAKKIAYTLVKNGWISDEQIKQLVEANIREEWFSYEAILAVYMIHLNHNSGYIEQLTSLLGRNEDLLLEEVAAALISFQSNEVVDAVAPYLLNEESIIFAASIIENIKTDHAVEVLRQAYHHVGSEESKEIIFEALAHQLHPLAEPEIYDFMRNNPSSYFVNVEQLAYSYYKIMGLAHPMLETWRKLAESELYGEKISDTEIDYPADKLGRNDPCPCGSGKKYKKCCL